MIKELIKSENSLLHRRIDSCSYNLNRQELSKILIDSMIHHNGVGLSANQIGISERVRFKQEQDNKTKRYTDTWLEVKVR